MKRLIEVVLEIPLSLPYLVLGLALLILFSSPWGKAMKDAGFRVVFSANGIIMAQLIVNLPLAIRMLRTAFSEIDLRLEYIAATLGASRWKCFSKITLPLARNGILSAVVMVWSRAIGEFGATLMLVGVTRMKTETLPGSIYLNVSTGDNDMALAAATILLFISSLSMVLSGLFSRADRHRRIRGGDSYW
jgi:molybdate transport system permease protein